MVNLVVLVLVRHTEIVTLHIIGILHSDITFVREYTKAPHNLESKLSLLKLTSYIIGVFKLFNQVCLSALANSFVNSLKL